MVGLSAGGNLGNTRSPGPTPHEYARGLRIKPLNTLRAYPAERERDPQCTRRTYGRPRSNTTPGRERDLAAAPLAKPMPARRSCLALCTAVSSILSILAPQLTQSPSSPSPLHTRDGGWRGVGTTHSAGTTHTHTSPTPTQECSTEGRGTERMSTPPPDAMLLICPVLNLNRSPSPSRVAFCSDTLLPQPLLAAFAEAYDGGGDQSVWGDPLLSPALAPDAVLRRLPPTNIQARPHARHHPVRTPARPASPRGCKHTLQAHGASIPCKRTLHAHNARARCNGAALPALPALPAARLARIRHRWALIPLPVRLCRDTFAEHL